MRRIIACVGTAAAPGTTTVAVQLAYNFAEKANVDTAIVDFDLDGSPLAEIFGVNNTGAMSSLWDMAQIGELTEEAMSLALQTAGEHLRVVTGFRNLELGPGFTVSKAQRVISGIANRMDITILDVGRPRPWSALEFLKQVDVICWVVTPTPEGAAAWARMWPLFEGRGLSRNRMVAVVNKYDHPNSLLNFVPEFAQHSGIRVVAKVPYLPKTDSEHLYKPRGSRLAPKGEREAFHAYDDFLQQVLEGVKRFGPDRLSSASVLQLPEERTE